MKQSDRKMNKKISPFVTKLLNILDDTKSQNCVRWVSQDSFVVSDSDDLSHNVLSKYFKHSNFSSFIRQLNIYGFEKIKTQQNHHYYHHKNFIKNNRKQLRLIQRKLKKNSPEDNIEQMEQQEIKNPKYSTSIQEVVNQLREENKKIKNQNNNLNKIIQEIKQENKKQIQNMKNFLTLLLQNCKNNQGYGQKSMIKKAATYQNAIELLNNELKNQNIKQNQKMAINFHSIFRVLNSIIEQKSYEQVSSQSKTLEFKDYYEKELQLQNQNIHCRQEQNKIQLKQGDQFDLGQPQSGLNIDNFF